LKVAAQTVVDMVDIAEDDAEAPLSLVGGFPRAL